MANMGYCRMANTLRDLTDCYENMENVNSREERNNRRALIELAQKIAEEYGYMTEPSFRYGEDEIEDEEDE